jgi:hypothetical protein
MIIDFSHEPSSTIRDICKEFHTSRVPGFALVERPGAGFCDNLNYSLDEAQLRDFDILFEVNDDSMVHSMFFSNALDFYSYNRNFVFVGGVPQESGGWNEPMKRCYMPNPEDKVEEVTNFCRLWWEVSACSFNLEKVGAERFDVAFDAMFGLCADNDFLLRLSQRYPHKVIRHYGLRFWHARGITQQKFGRDPRQPIDIHKIEAARYFKDKWGPDLSNMEKIITVDQCYKIPFNGKNERESSLGNVVIKDE